MSDLRFSLEQQLAAADGVLDRRPRRADVGLVLLIDRLGQAAQSALPTLLLSEGAKRLGELEGMAAALGCRIRPRFDRCRVLQRPRPHA